MPGGLIFLPLDQPALFTAHRMFEAVRDFQWEFYFRRQVHISEGLGGFSR